MYQRFENYIVHQKFFSSISFSEDQLFDEDLFELKSILGKIGGQDDIHIHFDSS